MLFSWPTLSYIKELRAYHVLATVAPTLIISRKVRGGRPSKLRYASLSRSCLVPADGFYVWAGTAKLKQPYCFVVNDGELFAFAELWERWKDPSGRWIRSCSILTTERRYFGKHPKRTVLLSVHE